MAHSHSSFFENKPFSPPFFLPRFGRYISQAISRSIAVAIAQLTITALTGD
jgi:hypothetical protein